MRAFDIEHMTRGDLVWVIDGSKEVPGVFQYYIAHAETAAVLVPSKPLPDVDYYVLRHAIRPRDTLKRRNGDFVYWHDEAGELHIAPVETNMWPLVRQLVGATVSRVDHTSYGDVTITFSGVK